jgi:hypothetical protein
LVLTAVAGCATVPKGVDKEAKPADIDSLKSVGAKANAIVVFASSRTGTSHIFSMKSDGSEPHQLTKGNLTDWNPRFSPDGTKILFSRSVEKGARETEAGADHAWDLFTVKPDGTEPTKVVANATWGSWISNDEILFVRGSKIMRLKLDGEEKRVMDLSRHAVFEGSTVRNPELSKDGHEIAMTIVGAHRQVGVWSLKKKAWKQIGSGAHITWFPDGSAMTWISPTGKDLSEIVRLSVGAPPPKAKAEKETEKEESEDEADESETPAAPTVSKLVDLRGKRSREAFPRVSADGKWLVFGAAIGSAEADLEDYELYLWEIGSDVSPTRLTFNSASDRWPDLFVGGAPATEEAAKTEESAKPEESGAAATEKADKGPAEEPAEKSEPENKEEPTAAAAEEAPADEAVDSGPAKKGKAKARPAAKKKRR